MTYCTVTEDEARLFGDLTKDQKTALVRLMARLMEKSYRRGVQQGIEMSTDERCRFQNNEEGRGKLVNWRYNESLDSSVGIDPNAYTTTSLERLEMEETDMLINMKLFVAVRNA